MPKCAQLILPLSSPPKRQLRVLFEKIAVNSLLLTHGGPQSAADNVCRKRIALTDVCCWSLCEVNTNMQPSLNLNFSIKPAHLEL